MITRIIKTSLGHQGAVLLLANLLFLAGLWGAFSLNIDAIPDLSDKQVIIHTPYPGQSPQIIEDQITYPLSTGLLGVPGAKTLRGYSFFGDAYLYIIFDDKTDIYWARSRVQEQLSQLQTKLPPTVSPKLGPDASGVGWIYQYALVDRTGRHNLHELTQLQKDGLALSLQSLEGVSEVATLGGMDAELQVVVDPLKLQAYNIPLSKVRKAIEGSSGEASASVIEMAEAEYQIRLTGFVETRHDLGLLPIGKDATGLPLLLKEVAEIRKGPAKRRGIAELNGEGEVVSGIVVMRYDANPQQVITAVKNKLNVLSKSLPEGVEIITVYDRSEFIGQTITNTVQKLGQELLIVSLIIALMLFSMRAALITLIITPLGILTALLIMHLQGITANLMSLAGIALAIGTMVDGIIVLLDNVQKQSSEENKLARIQQAITEVAPGIFSSLLVITLSFLPILLLEGEEGKLFAPLAYTKTYAMAAAAFLSITVTPVLIALLYKKTKVTKKHATLYHPSRYLAVVKRLRQYPTLLGLSLLVFTGTSLWPLLNSDQELMPDINEGDLLYMPSTYPAISIGQARVLLQQTDKLLMEHPEVVQVLGKIGRANTATDPAPLTMIETLIKLKPTSQWREGITLNQIKRELNEQVKLPGISNTFVMPIKTRIDMLSTGLKSPLGLKLSGNDMQLLQDTALAIEDLLISKGLNATIYAERLGSGRYVTITPKRQALAQYGLSLKAFQTLAVTALGGQVVTHTLDQTTKIGISLRYPASFRDSLYELNHLPLLLEDGHLITLNDVAALTLEKGPASIKSENAQKVIWLYITPEGPASAFLNKANPLLEQFHQPGVTLEWEGDAQKLKATQLKLGFIVLLVLLLAMIIIYQQFQRALPVCLLFGLLPAVVASSLWVTYLFDITLSITVAVGVIAAIGIALETFLMMLIYLQRASAKQGNEEEVLKAGANRLRPIVLTTLATLAGLIPMLSASGTGSEVLSRLSIPMIGGVIAAAIISLFCLPVFYTWLVNHKAPVKP